MEPSSTIKGLLLNVIVVILMGTLPKTIPKEKNMSKPKLLFLKRLNHKKRNKESTQQSYNPKEIF